MRTLIVGTCLLFFFVGSASAQGVQASVNPNWNTLSAIANVFPARTDLRGSDINIGYVIGGDIESGDWGVNLVRRNFAARSVIEDVGGCLSSPGSTCVPSGTVYELGAVSMTGVEFYTFKPFLNVQRFQLGFTFAGGIAKMGGSVTKRGVIDTPSGRRETSISTVSVEQALSEAGGSSGSPVKNIFPLGRIELTAAVKLTPHLKFKIGGGFVFPGTSKLDTGMVFLF